MPLLLPAGRYVLSGLGLNPHNGIATVSSGATQSTATEIATVRGLDVGVSGFVNCEGVGKN